MEIQLLVTVLAFVIGWFVFRRVLRMIFGGNTRTTPTPRNPTGPRRQDEAWGGIKMESPPPPPTPIEVDPDMPQQHHPLDIPPPDSPDRIHVPLDPSQPIRQGSQEPSPYRDTFDAPAPQRAPRPADDQFGGYDPFNEREPERDNATFGHYETKADDITRRLEELESYRDQGVITEKEYKEKRWEILQGKR